MRHHVECGGNDFQGAIYFVTYFHYFVLKISNGSVLGTPDKRRDVYRANPVCPTVLNLTRQKAHSFVFNVCGSVTAHIVREAATAAEHTI